MNAWRSALISPASTNGRPVSALPVETIEAGAKAGSSTSSVGIRSYLTGRFAPREVMDNKNDFVNPHDFY
jgi:hypothetical protein